MGEGALWGMIDGKLEHGEMEKLELGKWMNEEMEKYRNEEKGEWGMG